jgi:D-glycero-D-manno-heptose 1,7-bisphosphate phosphatase
MTAASEALVSWVRIDATPRRGGPALFLDRDGTLIENTPYLADPAGVRVIQGARETIAAFRAEGFAIIIVTNQSGVARGLCSPEQYRAVEARVLEQLGPGTVDAVYACPFHPAGQGEFAREHPWRKPDAGMLLDAAARFQLDLKRSVMVGDSLSDMRAGAKAGTGWLVHTLTGHGAAERPMVEAFAATLQTQTTKLSVRYVSSIGELATIACTA